MSWLRRLTVPFAARRLARLVRAHGASHGAQALAAEADGPALWCATAEILADAGDLPLALDLLVRAPRVADVLRLQAAIEGELDEGSELETLTALLRLTPDAEGVARAVAAIHADNRSPARVADVLGPFAGSIDPGTARLLGRALVALGRDDEAIAALRPVVAHLERIGATQPTDEPYLELQPLYENALARQRGAEAVTVDRALRKQLDPGSGINHRLLAKSLMLGAPRVAPTLRLGTVRALRALADELEPKDPAGAHVQRGLANLRDERLSHAERDFQRAVEASPRHFGAVLGSAVVRDVRQRALITLAGAIREESAPPQLEQVVPDWPQLTRIERRVVVASTWPVRRLLPALAKVGAQIRILPIDVRATDLPELADVRGVRVEEDHRSWEGIEGMASERFSVSKIEELYDVTAGGWTFAHELAHLGERVLPKAARRRLDELFRRATRARAEYAFDQYALRNVHEFFAVHATLALVRRLGLALELELDDEGLLESTLDFFVALQGGAYDDTASA